MSATMMSLMGSLQWWLCQKTKKSLKKHVYHCTFSRSSKGFTYRKSELLQDFNSCCGTVFEKLEHGTKAMYIM